MKKITSPLFIYILLATAFIQCKKDKDISAPADLKKDLLVYFPLNGNFNDSTKTAQGVTFGGFMSSIKNKYGYSNRAMNFNGGLFSFGTDGWRANAMTISFWVKPNDLNTDAYLVLSSDEAFVVLQSKSKLGLAISCPTMEAALADITTEWTHFAGTYNGQDIKTYINGKLATTFHHPGVPNVTNHITIGAPGILEWKGGLDEIRFYSRILSDEEIKLLAGF